jgi:hypothetical protein
MNFTSVLVGVPLITEVRKAIDALMKVNEEFTPHQITQKVRQSVGPMVEVVHNDVRSTVLTEMTQYNDYDSYMKDYGNGVTARTYRPLPGVGKQKKIVHTLPLHVTGNLQVTKSQKDAGKLIATMTPKSEGRVTVPAAALKKIGVMTGDTVYLTKFNNLLTLSKTTGHTKYKTDKYGSVRLRHKYLQDYTKFSVRLLKDSNCVQLVGEK